MEADLPLCTYKSAGGVVVAETGALVLVLARVKRLGPDERPEIRLPKGHIEPGEEGSEAALREVREESGLADLAIVDDLGHQLVRFVWKRTRYERDESYFLMVVDPGAEHNLPEEQFERLWLSWADALAQLTFEAEREWVRRAQIAWGKRLEDISDQDTEQANNHTQMQKKIAIGEQE